MKKIHPIRKILPSILAFITGRERYLPRVEWVDNLWTHNIFRAFELVFWRAFGPNGKGDTIRAEASASLQVENGRAYVRREFYSVEALIAHGEGMVRQSLANAAAKLKGGELPFEYIPRPVLAGLTIAIFGMEIKMNGGSFMAPLFAGAVAYDTSGEKDTGTGNPNTLSFTTSGSNRYLAVAATNQNSSNIGTATYAGNNLTVIDNVYYSSIPGMKCYALHQVNPTVGANTLSIAWGGGNGIRFVVVSYTGAKQSGQPDSYAKTQQSSAGSISTSTTVVLSNSWLVSIIQAYNCIFNQPGVNGNVTPGSDTATQRQVIDDQVGIADSNGTVASGSRTGSWSQHVNSNLQGQIVWSIAPGSAQYDQSITATASISASVIKQVPKTIVATSTITGNVFKGLSKTLIANATATASMVKQMSKSLIAEVAVSASMVATKVYLQTLTATANVSAAITKIPGKLLSATTAVSADVSKALSLVRTLTATTAVSASVKKGLSKTLAATTAVSAVITKTPAKVLAATTAVSATISTGFAKVLTATTNITASLVAGRAVIMVATTEVSATITKTPQKMLTAIITIIGKIRAPFYRVKYPAHGDGADYEVKYPHDTV